MDWKFPQLKELLIPAFSGCGGAPIPAGSQELCGCGTWEHEAVLTLQGYSSFKKFCDFIRLKSSIIRILEKTSKLVWLFTAEIRDDSGSATGTARTQVRS